MHFAVHHVPERPSAPAKPVSKALLAQLSTGLETTVSTPVDDSAAPAAPDAVWLGAVVPKRHAKRSVTRSLLKRQIRAAVLGHERALAGGLWVVRLRAPFDRKSFVSAGSEALKSAARTELEQVLASAVQRAAGR